MSDQTAADSEIRTAELFSRWLPHWAMRTLGWLIFALFFCALLFSVLVKVPEKVEARFVLVPEGGTDPVLAPVQGELDQVLIREGELVAAGQPVLWIRSREVRDWRTEHDSLAEELSNLRLHQQRLPLQQQAEQRSASTEAVRLQQQIDHLSSELERHQQASARKLEAFDAKLAMQEGKIRSLAREIEFQRQYLDTYAQYLKASESLQKKGAVAKTELNFRRLSFAEAQLKKVQAEEAHQLARLELDAMQIEKRRLQDESETRRIEMALEQQGYQSDLQISRNQQQSKQLEHEHQRQSLETEIAAKQLRLAALAERLAHAEGDRYPLLAPFAGAIYSLTLNTPGDVIDRGRELFRVAPHQAPLRAELQVPATGVAMLKEQQPVLLMFDAFPYQRFGVRESRLNWVSPVADSGGEGDSFRALATMDNPSLTIGGARQPLRAGMEGNARILVGKRLLIQYAFSPLDRLLNQTP